MGNEPLRVVLYSHDSQGLGHLRRNLAIAHHLAQGLPALTGRKVAGLIVSGLAPTFRFPLPDGFDWVTIPGISKGKDGYQPRHLGGDTGPLISLRSALLEAALVGFAPDLVIVDRHIYGVWHELRAPLRRLRHVHPSARVVLGLREVLDTPHVVAAEWERLGKPEALRSLVDKVWVYGDPQVHDQVLSGEAPPALCDRIEFTGYLAHGRRITDAFDHTLTGPFVLTTAGGGEDGHGLLAAAVQATPPPGHTHVVVTGPQLDDATFAQLAAAAGPNTQVLRSLPGLGRHIASAAAVVSMCGYNTACEILDTDTPSLIVPREIPRQEQLIRARALEKVGAVDVLEQSQVSSAALSQWLATAVQRRVDRSHVDGDGLQRVSQLAAQLLQLPSRTLVGGAA